MASEDVANLYIYDSVVNRFLESTPLRHPDIYVRVHLPWHTSNFLLDRLFRLVDSSATDLFMYCVVKVLLQMYLNTAHIHI